MTASAECRLEATFSKAWLGKKTCSYCLDFPTFFELKISSVSQGIRKYKRGTDTNVQHRDLWFKAGEEGGGQWSHKICLIVQTTVYIF